jgi:8-amino-7-oxononanoate synthase
MIAKRFARHQQTLSRLTVSNRQRELTCPSGIDFTSNDYLALSHSTRIRDAISIAIQNGIAVGAGGSRLLRGNHPVFAELEAQAANFFKSEKALFFSSGYSANMALFATLPQRGDIILYDELVHASVLDGIKHGRAQAASIRHNNIEDAASQLKQWRKTGATGRPWLAVESLYSMDGDRAPLSELITLVQEHDGFLVVDEAHATGVFGADGRGLTAFLEGRDNVVTLHTCGKALGVSGAFICLNKIFCDYLINRARTFIYSTAPSPLIAVAVSEALTIIASEPLPRKRLETLYTFANGELSRLTGMTGSGSQILPVHIGNNHRTLRIASRMQQAGFDIRAIRPPTVPEGTARLRLSITLHVCEEDISNMLRQLVILMQEEKS